MLRSSCVFVLALAGVSGALVAACTTPLPIPADAGGSLDAPAADSPEVDAPAVDAPADAPADGGEAADVPMMPDAPILPGTIGAPCATPADACTEGVCVDGFCCETPCAGTCMACASDLTGVANGTCAPVSAGLADPACPMDSMNTCQRDGTCDGAGACALWPAGTSCATPNCARPNEARIRTCNGTGACIETRIPCGNYLCQPDGTCLTSCTTTNCYRGSCVGGMCVSSGNPLGATCAIGLDCSSGFCVDGVCCDSACGGTCMRCDGLDTPTAAGTCGPVSCSDPDGECGGGICSAGACADVPPC